MDEMPKDTAERLASWSDLASMVLLGISLLVGGLTPRRPVWGWWGPRRLAITLAMLALVAWTGFRFVYEGITTSGPREFLAGSVVYVATWLYLLLRTSFAPFWFREARMFRVAQALRGVHNLRIGKSSDGRNSGIITGTDDSRIRTRGEWEVVLRKGVKKAADKTRDYWRGFMDPKPVWYPNEEVWDVVLLEEDMHKDKLDIFGTIDLMKSSENVTQKAYLHFYNVVLTALATPTNSANGAASGQGTSSTQPSHSPATTSTTSASQGAQTPPPMPPQQQQTQQQQAQRLLPEVDFTEFTKRWTLLPPEFIATQVNATDDRTIGGVARRVAADAVAYVSNKKKVFSTEDQVDMLNRCLEDTRKIALTMGP